MAKTCEVPRALRERVVEFHKDAFSVRKIARRLDMKHTTVQYIIQQFKKTGRVENKKGRGRKRVTSSRTDRYIKEVVMRDRKLSAKQLVKQVEASTGTKVSTQTIRNRLRERGLHGRIPRKKQFISQKNKMKCLNFAREHIDKPARFWKTVLWSDESKFNMFGSDGRQRVWRILKEEYSPKCLKPTVKHGSGNVLVWGRMAFAGVGNLHFIEEIMNADLYKSLLSQQMMPSAAKLLGRHFVFQHDNDPKHTANL